MFLSLDGTFFVQLANFIVFFALLTVLFWRPLGEGIRKRREYINGVVADYDRHQAEAKTLRQNAEKVRADARRDAEQILTKSRADGSNQAAEIGARYAAEVQATVEAAQKTVAGELEAARANEARLVDQLAAIMVEQSVAGGAK